MSNSLSFVCILATSLASLRASAAAQSAKAKEEVAPAPVWEATVTPGGGLQSAGKQNKGNRFATLEAAVAASREQPGKVRIIVLGPGRYYLRNTLILDARDSALALSGAGMGKTVVYGGKRITGWHRDGDKFWAADVPEVKAGKWDFRALVVNDRLCPRSRLPAEGRFEHENRFPVRWMSTAGGGWERKPTRKELTTMRYRPGDLGPWLSVRNAEVTVYHMWDESMVGVASHDPKTRTLTFSSPLGHPPGAFGVKTYVVWNVRKGMTKPGQWYLDRDRGKIVYWPLPKEDMHKALVVAPTVETIIAIQGVRAKPVDGVRIAGLTLSTTTTPCKAGGFGANRYRGALQVAWTRGAEIQGVEVANVAGHGIREWGSRDLRISQCWLHNLGAGGCRIGGGTGRIENNRIAHVGVFYPSAIGLSVSGGDSRYVVRRNEIHHTSYSGMTAGGKASIIEDNLLYNCMQELQDGAAIYVSGAKGIVIRRNMARNIVPHGKGYGVSSYYLDEKCRDCVIEKNVSVGVARPVLTHMTLNCAVRDNVFITGGDMTLAFSRSSGVRVTGNTFLLDGKLKITDPDAVAVWNKNLTFQAGTGVPAISDVLSRPPRKVRNTPRYANVQRVGTPPTLDGKLGGTEWPPGGTALGELNDQRRARGAPLLAKFCADATSLYIGVSVVCMFPDDRKLGTTWGQDEGVEVAVQGRGDKGAPVTYVFRGFTNGKLVYLPVGGAALAEARRVQREIGFAASVSKKVWTCEWRIPFKALRFTPEAKAQLPLNMTVYRSEDNQSIQWAGTRGPTWDLKRGGRLLFRHFGADKSTHAKPTVEAAVLPRGPDETAKPTSGQWTGTRLAMEETPSGTPLAGKPCSAEVAVDEKFLQVRVEVPVSGPSALTRGRQWRTDDGAEVCLRGRTADGGTVTWVVHGFADGGFEVSPEAGTPVADCRRFEKAVRFHARVKKDAWIAQWTIPLKAAGIPGGKARDIPFNLGVFRSEGNQWINWVGTQGPTWKLDNAGLLRLPGPAK